MRGDTVAGAREEGGECGVVGETRRRKFTSSSPPHTTQPRPLPQLACYQLRGPPAGLCAPPGGPAAAVGRVAGELKMRGVWDGRARFFFFFFFPPRRLSIEAPPRRLNTSTQSRSHAIRVRTPTFPPLPYPKKCAGGLSGRQHPGGPPAGGRPAHGRSARGRPAAGWWRGCAGLAAPARLHGRPERWRGRPGRRRPAGGPVWRAARPGAGARGARACCPLLHVQRRARPAAWPSRPGRGGRHGWGWLGHDGKRFGVV